MLDPVVTVFPTDEWSTAPRSWFCGDSPTQNCKAGELCLLKRTPISPPSFGTGWTPKLAYLESQPSSTKLFTVITNRSYNLGWLSQFLRKVDSASSCMTPMAHLT